MVAFATLASFATIVFSWQVAYVVSQLFVGRESIENLWNNLIIALCAGGLRAAVVFAQDLVAHFSAARVKLELRAKFNKALAKLGVEWLSRQSSASLNVLSTTGLDSLDVYFSKYLPQLIYTAIITPVFIAVIWSQDASSAAVLVITLPLIPLFMVLIGWATRKAQESQLDALLKLSQHFLDALRGITTLRVFNRAKAQVSLLYETSEQLKTRTMKVLRISFLSGFALELLASLSVAIIAVSIGLRLVEAELSLFVGLFVLLLAPEAYLPIRMIGAQFHAASEGVAASESILNIIEEADNRSISKTAIHPEAQGDKPEFVVITGPSGSGKTTLMNSQIDLTDKALLGQISWCPQTPALFAGTVQQNITGPGVADVNRLKTALEYAALDDLDLGLDVGEAGARISGGQAQRLALARCFYRAQQTGVWKIFLDEPISSLDQKRAEKVCQSLRHFVDQGYFVLAISHQSQLIESADRIVEVLNG